jgi:branched-chain amino acid transport system ATP-binding protein
MIELFGELSVLDHVLVALQAHRHQQGIWRDLSRGVKPTPSELDACHEALALCGIDAFANEPAVALSLGQRRAVELARAIVVQPRLLLADEPSSGLNRDETTELVDRMNQIRRLHGTTFIVVDHDLAAIQGVSDRVIALEAGAVIADGTFDEVVHTPRVITSWLGERA